jgi:hypothetical protein
MTYAFALAYIALLGVVHLLIEHWTPNGNADLTYGMWFGPLPSEGEKWSRYQWRRTTYCLKWLAAAATLVALFSMRTPLHRAVDETVLLTGGILSALTGMVALAAAIQFSCATLRARTLGPDPRFIYVEEEFVPPNMDPESMDEIDWYEYCCDGPSAWLIAQNGPDELARVPILSRSILAIMNAKPKLENES